MLENGDKYLKILKDTSSFDVQLGVELSKIMKPNHKTWIKCFHDFSKLYDEDWGGFGQSPKFPQPSILDFLFYVSYKTSKSSKEKDSLDMALKTLQKMAMGGIHDHIGQVSIKKHL